MPDHVHTLERWTIVCQPIIEQVLQDRVEVLLGWVPRLYQVVIDFQGVNGADGGIGIRVGREQDTFGIWEECQRLLEEFDLLAIACHLLFK